MKHKVIAIIPTLFGSRRLPGKALIDIMGKPILQHIIERLKRCQLIDQIVLAIADEKDSPILAFAEKHKIEHFVGDRQNILDRFYRTAEKYGADVIVRICHDKAMIDPQIVDKIIRFYLSNEKKLDYVSNTLIPSYPQGQALEVFSLETLRFAWQNAKQPYQKEHVTIYIYEHPEIFRIANVKNDKNLFHMRWTVDEKEDLEFVREIYKRLYKNGKIFSMEDILALLKKEPKLMEINKHIKPKALESKTWRHRNGV